MTKFEKYCVPRKNVIYERYIFHTRVQLEDESIDSFVTDLRLKSKTREFGELKESLIRDRLVVGIRDVKLKEKLLRDPTLNLDRAVGVCKANEAAQAQMKVLTGAEKAVNVVKKGKVGKQKQTKPLAQNQTNLPRYNQTMKYPCKRCGKIHKFQECPAWGHTCKKCSRPNHFEAKCMLFRNVQAVGVVDSESEESSEDYEEDDFVMTIKLNEDDNEDDLYVSTVNEGKCEWIATLAVNGSLIPLKVDSGAQVNLLNCKDYQALTPKPKLHKRVVKLKTYNDEPIKTVGVCIARIEINGKFKNVKFVVVPENLQSIIGANDSERLGLVKRNSNVKKVHVVKCEDLSTETVHKEYGEVFKGLGRLEGKCPIHLKENPVPTIYPARKVPHAMKEKLKNEIHRLEKLEVLEKTTEPTDWVLPLVIVEKTNGDLRVCIDPMKLNDYVRREHCHLPHRTEIYNDMAGAQYFSKLDASQGFHHLQLDEASSKLCTVATPFGRYSFKRMPYGVSCAPEIFHSKVQQMFESHQGTRVYMDDLIIWGETKNEHDQRLRAALETVRDKGMKLNKTKCVFGVQ